MSENELHTDRFEELCAAYVLHALDTDERQEFDDLLDDATPAQQGLFYSYQSTANQLAFTVERAEPSKAVKKQIMKQIRNQESAAEPVPITGSEESSTRSNRFAMAIAASFALLIITVALVFYTFNQYSTINHQKTKITKLESQVKKKEQMLSILGARDVDLVMMNGLDVNPKGYGKVIWDADKQQALLQVSNLPAVPAGKAYELWLIKGNKPLPSGVFSVSQTDNNAFFKIEQMASASKQTASSFAITLEPEGGSPSGKPTGDMYMLGNVNKKTE